MKRAILIAAILFALTVSGAEQKFPKFTLNDLEGNAVSIDSILNLGKPVALTFWATWCKPCRKELDKFVENWENWDTTKGEHPYLVVALCEDGPRSLRKAKALAKKQKWDNFILLYDKSGEVKKRAGVADIPELFLLKPDGSIYYRHIGFNVGDEKETFEKIDELKSEIQNESENTEQKK